VLEYLYNDYLIMGEIFYIMTIQIMGFGYVIMIIFIMEPRSAHTSGDGGHVMGVIFNLD